MARLFKADVSLQAVVAGVWEGTPIAVAYGGTGGTTAQTAREGIGLGASDDVTFSTLAATLTGNVTGDVTGDVTGNVSGSAGTVTSLLGHVLADLDDGGSVPTKYTELIGDGMLDSIVVTHSKNTKNVSVTVYDVTTGAEVDCNITRNTVDQVTLGFDDGAPDTESLIVVII